MNTKIINELKISKIANERHKRPDFDIQFVKMGEEEFERIKNGVKKNGWKIVLTCSNQVTISGPNSKEEAAAALGINVQQIFAALTPSQQQMMAASKDVRNIANIITEDPSMIVESPEIYLSSRNFNGQTLLPSGLDERKCRGWGHFISADISGFNAGFGIFDIHCVIGANWYAGERQTRDYPEEPAYWEWGIIHIDGVGPYSESSLDEISLNHHDSKAIEVPENPLDDTEDEYVSNEPIVWVKGTELTPDIKRKFEDAIESEFEKDRGARMQEELGDWAGENWDD